MTRCLCLISVARLVTFTLLTTYYYKMQIGCNEGIIVECNIQLQNITISYFLIETKSHFKLQEKQTEYNISAQINLV